MSESPSPEFRASDAEREQTVELLRHAATEGRLTVDELDERAQAAYRVRTRRELEELVADVSALPILHAGGSLAAAATGHQLVVPDGPEGTKRIVSIMGGHDRTGRWRVGTSLKILNVMGGTDLDFNDAELSAPVTELRIISIMGGSDIRVPEGVEIEISQFAFMGGNDIKLGDERPPSGAPVIRIRMVSIMGGCSIRRGRRLSRAERREQKELRREQRREQLREAAMQKELSKAQDKEPE